MKLRVQKRWLRLRQRILDRALASDLSCGQDERTPSPLRVPLISTRSRFSRVSGRSDRGYRRRAAITFGACTLQGFYNDIRDQLAHDIQTLAVTIHPTAYTHESPGA